VQAEQPAAAQRRARGGVAERERGLRRRERRVAAQLDDHRRLEALGLCHRAQRHMHRVRGHGGEVARVRAGDAGAAGRERVRGAVEALGAELVVAEAAEQLADLRARPPFG
jgi:hypothetical protein